MVIFERCCCPPDLLFHIRFFQLFAIKRIKASFSPNIRFDSRIYKIKYSLRLCSIRFKIFDLKQGKAKNEIFASKFASICFKLFASIRPCMFSCPFHSRVRVCVSIRAMSMTVTVSVDIDMQDGHGQLDVQHGHGWLDMQHGHYMKHEHEHAAWTWTTGHAIWTRTIGHAAWTWYSMDTGCSLDMDMHHAWIWTCSMDLDMQHRHLHVAWP